MSHQSAAPHAGSGSDRPSVDRRPEALETLEVRWFAHGRIPDSAVEWFEGVSPSIEIEERIDTYLVTGRVDLGVKRRDAGPLEVKERRRIGSRIAVGDRLEAQVEEWHKHTSVRTATETDRWVKIAKTVRTYPFRTNTSGGHTAGCDIELAAVEAGGVKAWTLAFEASGPASERMGTLVAAIDRFTSVADVPADLAAALELEAGYPAWLVEITRS